MSYLVYAFGPLLLGLSVIAVIAVVGTVVNTIKEKGYEKNEYNLTD